MQSALEGSDRDGNGETKGIDLSRPGLYCIAVAKDGSFR